MPIRTRITIEARKRCAGIERNFHTVFDEWTTGTQKPHDATSCINPPRALRSAHALVLGASRSPRAHMPKIVL